MKISTTLLKKLAWSFGRAFVASFVVGIAGIAVVPDLSAAKALLLAATIAALTAGARAAEHVVVVNVLGKNPTT
jgi:hypothetical protein